MQHNFDKVSRIRLRTIRNRPETGIMRYYDAKKSKKKI
jgi:hypothetical protein